MHRAKCLCVEEPLKDLWTALAQRIVQALLRSRAETVQRNTKSRNSNLRHVCVLIASKIYATACPTGGRRGGSARIGRGAGLRQGKGSHGPQPVRPRSCLP